MSEEIKNKDTVMPTLTLEPELEPEIPAPEPETSLMEPEPGMDPVQQEMAKMVLTPEEQEMVNSFAEKINVENTAQILQYGAGTQKKMADFSDEALKNVRAQDLGEIGELLTDVVGKLKDFDAEEEKSFFGFFKKQANKIENLKNKYDKAEANVEKITDSLQQHQIRLLKDSAMMDKMYEQNLLYFRELSMYILAGKKHLKDVREGRLKELEEKARLSGLPEDAQAARDFDSKCTRFEKKIHDLELTRMVSLQTAPQIRLVQNNDTVMAEKIQTTIVNTIPLWKSQMVLALGIAHSSEAARAQRQVSDVTNELLRKNAEKLHMASVETAKESERGIVDLETLKQTNAELIQTLDDVMHIQKEGRARRQAAEAEMARMENDLKAKLLEIHR
nr:toxic anion resistance protein [uncultured Blautia sp.]